MRSGRGLVHRATAFAGMRTARPRRMTVSRPSAIMRRIVRSDTCQFSATCRTVRSSLSTGGLLPLCPWLICERPSSRMDLAMSWVPNPRHGQPPADGLPSLALAGIPPPRSRSLLGIVRPRGRVADPGAARSDCGRSCYTARGDPIVMRAQLCFRRDPSPPKLSNRDQAAFAKIECPPPALADELGDFSDTPECVVRKRSRRGMVHDFSRSQLQRRI
jgi:hypothetical protein